MSDTPVTDLLIKMMEDLWNELAWGSGMPKELAGLRSIFDHE